MLNTARERKSATVTTPGAKNAEKLPRKPGVHWPRSWTLHTVLDPRHRLDIFPAPRTGGPAPAAIFFHGGFWRSGDKADLSLVAFGLRGLGASVFVVNYPLCPGASVEDAVGSARDDTRWIAANAANFGADPDRIFVFGHSTGAHLAAMCFCGGGRHRTELPHGMIKGALLTSGMYELEPIRLSSLNADLHLEPDDVASLSPARLRSSASGPIVVAVGDQETSEFRRQSESFAHAMTSGGASAHLAVVPDANHYTMLEQWRPGSHLLTLFQSLVRGVEVS